MRPNFSAFTVMCPECGSNSQVYRTRLEPRGLVRRERVCPKGHRFETVERPVPPRKRMTPSQAASVRWNKKRRRQ